MHNNSAYTSRIYPNNALLFPTETARIDSAEFFGFTCAGWAASYIHTWTRFYYYYSFALLFAVCCPPPPWFCLNDAYGWGTRMVGVVKRGYMIYRRVLFCTDIVECRRDNAPDVAPGVAKVCIKEKMLYRNRYIILWREKF